MSTNDWDTPIPALAKVPAGMPEPTTARDFECFTVTITKRAVDQLRKVSAIKGRTVEDLMEAAIEDACIMSERDY